MRKFRFPLEKVLKLRTHRERLARRDLAAAVGEVQRIDRHLEQVDGNLGSCREAGASAEPVAHLADALCGGLETVRRRLEKRRRDAEDRARQLGELWRARRVERESLGRLRERRHGEWRQEVQAAEQAELDELARLRAACPQPLEVMS